MSKDKKKKKKSSTYHNAALRCCFRNYRHPLKPCSGFLHCISVDKNNYLRDAVTCDRGLVFPLLSLSLFRLLQHTGLFVAIAAPPCVGCCCCGGGGGEAEAAARALVG